MDERWREGWMRGRSGRVGGDGGFRRGCSGDTCRYGGVSSDRTDYMYIRYNRPGLGISGSRCGNASGGSGAFGRCGSASNGTCRYRMVTLSS